MSNLTKKNIYAEEKTSVRVKIALLWTCTMLLYIYADIKAFFETDFIQQIMDGNLSGIEVNQSFLLISAILMTIPPIMIVLTMFIKANLIRIINFIVSFLFIMLAVSILFLAPEKPWLYYIWYSIFEIIFLTIIVILSVKWPTKKIII